jgi:hypothetical protein
MPNSDGSNDKKTWYTLSIIYSLNPRGCPPLGTISQGQAVSSYEKEILLLPNESLIFKLVMRHVKLANCEVKVTKKTFFSNFFLKTGK